MVICIHGFMHTGTSGCTHTSGYIHTCHGIPYILLVVCRLLAGMHTPVGMHTSRWYAFSCPWGLYFVRVCGKYSLTDIVPKKNVSDLASVEGGGGGGGSCVQYCTPPSLTPY